MDEFTYFSRDWFATRKEMRVGFVCKNNMINIFKVPHIPLTKDQQSFSLSRRIVFCEPSFSISFYTLIRLCYELVVCAIANLHCEGYWSKKINVTVYIKNGCILLFHNCAQP